MAQEKNPNEMSDVELTKLVVHEAAELAMLITAHIGKRPQIIPFGLTVVGYAVEMMMNTAAEGDPRQHDIMSQEWLDFMKQAHEDVKRIALDAKREGS